MENKYFVGVGIGHSVFDGRVSGLRISTFENNIFIYTEIVLQFVNMSKRVKRDEKSLGWTFFKKKVDSDSKAQCILCKCVLSQPPEALAEDASHCKDC